MTDSPGVYGGRRSSSGATALPVIETASKGEIDVQSAWESGKPVYRFPSESRRESLAKRNARLSLQNLQERYGAAELEPSASALLSQNKENEDVVRFSTRAGMAEKALKSLQLEVDELRRKEIKHRQQKEELRTINKKLSTEMESMGMTLLEQTKTLRVLSSEIQRQDPCRLVRTKRGSAVGDLSIPPPAIVKEDDVAVEQLTKQNTELLRLLSALESGRDEGLVCTVELQVLSCEIEPHGTSLSAVKGDLTPRVVVKGPYSRAHMLIETSAPLSPSLSPTYTGSSRVGRWSALRVSECAHLHFDVLSALPDKPDLLLGKHDVSLNAVISAAQKDPSGASSLHGLPLRNEHGEETGTVYIEVKVLPAFQFSGADGQPHSRAHLIAGAPRRHTLMSPTPLSKHSTPPIEFFVQVLSASSLLERSPGVPSNPYVVVIDTGAQREVFRTSVCDGESRSPSWDGAHVVYNIADAYDAYLGDFVFRVYDHLGEGCEEDDFLGEATYKKAALSQSLKCTVSQLKLCPRPQEPIPYITKYRDHLGTIQVRLCNFTPSRNDDTRCPSTSVEQSLRRDESQPPVLPPSVPAVVPLPVAPSVVPLPQPTPPASTVPAPPATLSASPPAAVPVSPIPSQDVTVDVPAVDPTIPQPNVTLHIKEVRNFTLENEDGEVAEELKPLLHSTAPLQVQVSTSTRSDLFTTPVSGDGRPVWDAIEGLFSTRIEEYDIVYFNVLLEGTIVATFHITADELLLTEGEHRFGLERNGEGCGRLIIDLVLLG